MRCIGTTTELKELYGEGYRLHISFKKIFHADNRLIIEEVMKVFNAKIINELDSRVILKVDKEKMLDCISWLKKREEINWLVGQPSLYDVFINFVT